MEDLWTIRSFPTFDHWQEILWHLPRCWFWTVWWCFSISWMCWPTSPSAPTIRGFHSSTLKLFLCEKCIIDTSAGSHMLIQGLSLRLPRGAIRIIVNVRKGLYWFPSGWSYSTFDIRCEAFVLSHYLLALIWRLHFFVRGTLKLQVKMENFAR